MRQSSGDIFVDTCILVAFSGVSRLELLWKTYPGRLVISKVVDDELKGQNFNLPFGRRIRRKEVKPFWIKTSSDVSDAVAQGLMRCQEPTTVEDTLALSLAGRMNPGEAAVYAMAFARGGVCCTNDMRAVRAKCESNGIPLLGVFGILHDAFDTGLLGIVNADTVIAAMVRNRVQIPRVSFAQVRDWFEKQLGPPLFG